MFPINIDLMLDFRCWHLKMQHGFKIKILNFIISNLKEIMSITRIISLRSSHLRKNKFVMFCAIWYHLFNLKNVKNTHGRVLLLVKVEAKSLQRYSLLKVTLLHGCFSPFLNCTNGTKSRNALILLLLIHFCLMFPFYTP